MPNSTIFKTFNSDSDKTLSKIGILGKSFEQIGASIRQRKIEIDNLMGAMSKKDAKAEVGSFWSYIFGNESIKEKTIDLSNFIELDNSKASNLLKSLQEIEIASKTNTSAWQEYFSTLSDGQKWQIDFVKNNDLQKSSTEDLVKANQQARASALAHNEAIKAQTFSAKAGKVALQALAIAGNMLLMWGVSKIISGLHELSQVSKTVANNAKELGNSFKSTSSDIESYKPKIKELYSTINDSNSSIEDVTNARKSLLSMHDELIDKFGTEESVINNITEAINGQTKALDELTKAKWQETKNEFTHGNFWNNTANFFQDTDNIQRMLDEYGEKTIAFTWADYADINKLTDGMVAELENNGINIKVSTDNLQAVRDFDSLTESISDTKGATLSITGNAEEIYNKLLALQNLIGNNDSFDKLYDKVRSTADSYKELTDKYKDFYDQYILQEKIFADDSKYADIFKNITDAAEKYNEAFTSGNEEEIKKASDEYASLLSSAMSTAIANGDSDVATYFKNMYPTLKSIINGWNFNVAFDANTDDLQGKVQTVLDKLKDENGRSLTAEEILGLDKENKQYQDLVAIANTYNMSIKEMIELLKERNIVSAMDYQGLVDLFGQENVDKLSSEDLEIAYTIKNVGNMTFEELQAGIQKAKETADDTPISLSISETITKLDELKDKFNTLDQTYAKLFDSDSQIGFEDLSSINEAFKDLDDIDNFIQRLQEAGQDTEAVTEVMQELIAAYLDYSGVLNNITEENASLIEQFLAEMGIENAHEIVLAQLSVQTETLALQKQFLAEKGCELIDATLEEIVQFLNDADASDEAKQSIAQLALAKLDLSSIQINETQSVKQLISLANAAGASAVAIAKAQQAIDTVNSINEKGANGSAGDFKRFDYAMQTVSQIKDNTYDWQYEKLDPNDFIVSTAPQYTPKYSGGSSTKKAIDDTAKDTKQSAEKATKETENQFEEMVDFFDRRCDMLNDTLSLLKTNLDNVTGSFAKNNLIDAELGTTEEKFKNYSDALNMYTQKANEALSKLPSDIAAKVKDGAVNLATFIGDGNKEVVEAIKDYEQWADKVTDCKQELAELRTAIRQLELDKFNNIMEEFSNQFNLREDGKDLISKQIELLKEAGQLIGKSFFTAQIDQSKKQLELLEEEKAKLVKQMTSAIGSGRVNRCPLLQ